MNEILISFELMTIIYMIILTPLLVILIVIGYKIGYTLAVGLMEKLNRRIVNKNKKVILENIKYCNELIDAQRELRKELELSKKEVI